MWSEVQMTQVMNKTDIPKVEKRYYFCLKCKLSDFTYISQVVELWNVA